VGNPEGNLIIGVVGSNPGVSNPERRQKS